MEEIAKALGMDCKLTTIHTQDIFLMHMKRSGASL